MEQSRGPISLMSEICMLPLVERYLLHYGKMFASVIV